MNTLTDRYTDGRLVEWPRWAHYLEKFGAGCGSLTGAYVVLAFSGEPRDPQTFAIACTISWMVYVVLVFMIAARAGTLTPWSGYLTWHQLTKLSLHALPMALGSFAVLARPVAFAWTALVVVAWLCAWPRDAG